MTTNERETLLAEIAERQARLAEIDAEPDYEAWRPALEAYYMRDGELDLTCDPLDEIDKANIRGLIAAFAKAPPMGECQPRWPSEAELDEMAHESSEWCNSLYAAAKQMARRIRAYQTGE
jgi:hypothetical protein